MSSFSLIRDQTIACLSNFSTPAIWYAIRYNRTTSSLSGRLMLFARLAGSSCRLAFANHSSSRPRS